MRWPVALVVVPLLAAGCGTSDDVDQVRDVTARFYDAVRADRGEAACDLLTDETASQLQSQSGQACGDVIKRLDYQGGSVAAAVVYVTSAKVDLSGGESAFLSLEPDGWRLSAVACRPVSGKPRDRPFECEVES
jgi:hypothetical protein